jgi:hypothetical protein
VERETGLEHATLCLGSRCSRRVADAAKNAKASILTDNPYATIQVVDVPKKFRHLNRFEKQTVSDMIPASKVGFPTC